MKKLKKKDKETLLQTIDWEGGLSGYARTGVEWDLIEGTNLEEPFKKFEKAYQELQELIDKEVGVL